MIGRSRTIRPRSATGNPAGPRGAGRRLAIVALAFALLGNLPVQGVVLADHIKSADWQARGSAHIATVPAEVVNEVRAKLKPLLGM